MDNMVIMTPISNLEIILGIIAVLSASALGITVYLKNPKSWTNRFFAFMALIYTLYPIANAISLHPIIPSVAHNLFWIRMNLFLGSFMASSLLMFAHTFPGKKITIPKKYLILTGVITLANAIMSFTPLFFPSLSYPEDSKTAVTTTGPMIFFYLFSFLTMSLASFIVLYKKYKKAIGEEKMKILYLMIGITATLFLTGIMVIFFVAVLNYTGTVFLGPIFPIILMTCTAYAIIKHKFLDIEPIIARAVSYTLLIITLTGIYAILLFYGINRILGLNLNTTIIIINAILAIVIATTFQPLHKFISKITDKLFFKGIYSTSKILSDLTQALTSSINFDILADNLLLTITKEMRISQASLLLVENNKIDNIKEINFTKKDFKKDIELEKFIKEYSTQNVRFFVFGDLQNEKHRNLFIKYNLEVIFPIRSNNNTVAMLMLGGKLSGLPYSSQDLSLLDVFASESGIAIENARLYTKLKIATDAKSRLISVVSHQLRTPVSGVRWGLEALKDKRAGENNNKNILNTSYEKILFLEQQLDDILIALDIYDQKILIKKESCNIKDIFENIVSDFKNSINVSELKINYAFGGDAETINADKIKIKKVFRTLVKNAIFYSEYGKEIIISSQKEKTGGSAKILITVSDRGLGVTENEQKSIFTEFFRSDRAKKKVPDGLGLGMFIAKEFIEAHSGKIWVYSKGVDQGTDIHIELPL